MIAAVTNVLLIDPTTNGTSPVAGSCGSTIASPLPLDQMLPSGNAIDAPIPGLPVDCCCWSRTAWSCGPSCAAIPVFGVSVRGGENEPSGVGPGVGGGVCGPPIDGGGVGPDGQHGEDSGGVVAGEGV